MGMLDKLFKRDDKGSVGVLIPQVGSDAICCEGYTPLNQVPEIVAAINIMAELISSITIKLMMNTDNGDVRIKNELSRKIDINPEKNMTRSTWMWGIVKDMLLDGSGNAIILPHTRKGQIVNLEPVSPVRWTFNYIGYRDYEVMIDGKAHKPSNLIHCVYNPDKVYKWKGTGITVSLRALADTLREAQKTKKAFLSSEWKPSIIVSVDALIDEFKDPEFRQKILDSYVKGARVGEPWLIPGAQFKVDQVKPLTLGDLAISDTVKMDREMIAALIGIPAFFLGVGDYDKAEYNQFISGRIMPIVKTIMQEFTKKLIVSEKWYLMGDVWSLLDYSPQEMSQVLLAGADRGYVCGDEWRKKMHLNPAGLQEFKILENYIPWDMSGKQKKLEGE